MYAKQFSNLYWKCKSFQQSRNYAQVQCFDCVLVVFVLFADQSAIKCDHNVYGRLLFFNLSHTIRCRQIVVEAGTDNGFGSRSRVCFTHTHTNSYYQKYSICRAILIQNNCNNIRSKYLNMRDRDGEVEREGSAATRKLSVEQLLIAVCSPAECYSIINCSLFCIYAAHTHTRTWTNAHTDTLPA